MTEHEAAQLIPWFLNGTLDPAEKEAVRDWIARSEEVRSELQKWKETWAVHATLPSGEELVAYVEGTLPTEVRRRIDDLVEVSEPTREAIAMLREGRPEEDAKGGDGVAVFRPRTSKSSSAAWARFSLPLAAALASAILTSLLWWSQARPEPPRAVANIAVVELLPSNTRVRGEASEPLEIASRGRFLAVLVSDLYEIADDLQVRVLDARGELRARLEGVGRAKDGTMTVLLSRPAGPTPHEIVVLDAAGVEVERFRLDLGSPTP